MLSSAQYWNLLMLTRFNKRHHICDIRHENTTLQLKFRTLAALVPLATLVLIFSLFLAYLTR